LVAHSALIGAEITPPYAQQVLRNFIDPQARKITIEFIQKMVAEQFGLRLVEIKAKDNSRAIVYPRQIAMYLAKQFTEASLPRSDVSSAVSTSTTVLHSVDKMEETRKVDKGLTNF
jgi:chromosomal replication initiator protein